MLATFYSHPVVFVTSEGELLTTLLASVSSLAIVASIVTWYRQSRCHVTTCRDRLKLRRRGKYALGHLKLCHVHHPHVPNDGVITTEHVDEITRRAPHA